MACDWGHEDCKWEGQKCHACILPDACYEPIKPKVVKRLKMRQDKADGRMGSGFEYANHKVMKKIFAGPETQVNVGMTLNSGATIKEKGDEQVHGLMEIMEELKTQEPDRIGGIKSFSIQRKWLNKLHNEALKERKEMWWLKFAFSEPEGEAGNAFIVIEQDVILSLALTVRNDRARQKIAQARAEVAEAKLNETQQECQLLKAKLETIEKQRKLDQEIEDAEIIGN